MIPSFIFRKRGSSAIGRPSRLRKTCDGSGTENCRAKSISRSSMKPSIRSLTRRSTGSVSSATRLGVNSGSRILRNLR